MLSENERWLVSYYRASEIAGATFFGRVARFARNAALATDLTQHFADEAKHAAWFTECLETMDAAPLKLNVAYQDDYLRTAGVPVNMMEILSITQVFERRVLNTYTKHAALPNTPMPIKRVLARIMRDEQWHVQWVKQALKDLEPTYGREHIASTVARHTQADRETYGRALQEHGERIAFLVNAA
jgi:rubrerythrin